MTKDKQEYKIFSEMLNYFDENQFNANNEPDFNKLRKWISDIITLEVQEIGYTTNIIIGDERNIEENLEEEKNIDIVFKSKESKYENIYGYFDAFVYQSLIEHKTFKIFFYEGNYEYQEEGRETAIILIKSVFHELEHIRQRLKCLTEVSSKDSLRFAKELILEAYLSELYIQNHDSFFLEENANIEAAKKESKIAMCYVREKHKSDYNVNGISINREEFANGIIDKMFAQSNNLILIEKLPILKKEYNENGTKKSSIQLLNNMKNEIDNIKKMDEISSEEKDILVSDCKEMYFELLYRAMRKSNKKELNTILDIYDENDKTRLLSDMEQVLLNVLKEELNDINRYIKINEEDINLRKKAYQEKIDFIKKLKDKQQGKTFLNRIINRGKSFVRMEKINVLSNKAEKETKETYNERE